jgi:hypothetical protein
MDKQSDTFRDRTYCTFGTFQISEALAFGEGLGKVGLAPGVHVVAGARDGCGDCEEIPGESGGDLQVEAGVAVLAGEQGGALARPVPMS